MWITSTCPVLRAQSTDVPHRTTSTLCQLQNRWAFWDLGSENRLTHNLCKQRVSAILALLQPATVPMRRFVRLSHGGAWEAYLEQAKRAQSNRLLAGQWVVREMHTFLSFRSVQTAFEPSK